MIDVVKELNAIRRQVRGRVLEAGECQTVTISREYDAAIDEVWDACTNPERVARWFMPLSGELRPGGHYRLQGNAGGTIQQCEPPTWFSVTWEYGNEVNWVELRLSPAENQSTRLELAHTVPDDEKWTEYGPGAVGPGWELALVGLQIHLEPEDRARQIDAAWTSTEDGDQFVRLSSERWREANIAAGADPSAAHAAAQRTTAFWCQPAPESVTHVGKGSTTK